MASFAVRVLVLLLFASPAYAGRGSYATGYMYSYYAPPAAGTPWRPAWSPDGKSWHSPRKLIWKIRVGDDTAHELANRGRTSPAWSPTGLDRLPPRASRASALVLLNVAWAGTRSPRFDLTSISWSPDGKAAGYVRGDAKARFHHVSRGERSGPRPVRAHRAPASDGTPVCQCVRQFSSQTFSPDGRVCWFQPRHSLSSRRHL
jgi:hypothetical protein